MMFDCSVNYDWIHGREKPWKCHKCDERFKLKNQLQAHIKWDHAY